MEDGRGLRRNQNGMRGRGPALCPGAEKGTFEGKLGNSEEARGLVNGVAPTLISGFRSLSRGSF